MSLSPDQKLVVCAEPISPTAIYSFSGDNTRNITGFTGYDSGLFGNTLVISEAGNVLYAYDENYNQISKLDLSQHKLGLAIWGDTLWLAVSLDEGWIHQYTMRIDDTGALALADKGKFAEHGPGMEMKSPRQLAVNGMRLAVSVFFSNKVHVFKISGEHLYSVSAVDGTSLLYPSDVALDQSNVLYISDTNRHRILVVSADGKSSKTLISSGVTSPTAMLLTGGDLYVCVTKWSPSFTAKIQKYKLTV
jgi:DNA-binding beta-propeller fold protein YncE